MNWKIIMILWQIVRPALKAAWPEFQRAVSDGKITREELGQICIKALQGLYGERDANA